MKTENVLKEKIGSLNTLSTGIVFGKEEAWDKLQARMDAPAKKIIPLKYWMAAAAILLLLVTVFFAFNNNTPVNEVVKIEKQTTPANAIPTSPVTQQPIAIDPQSNPTVAPVMIKHTTIKKQVAQPQPETQNIQIVQTPVVETPVVENTATVVVPVAKIPTKVMHINDIISAPLQQEATTITASVPSLNISGSQVLHLNDINDLQAQTANYLKQQKGFVFSIPLFNPSSTQTTGSINNEPSAPNNPLKFKLN